MSSKKTGSSPGYRFALLADPFPLLMRAKLCLYAFRLADPVDIVEPQAKVDFQIIRADSTEVSDLYRYTNAEVVKWRLSQGGLCWMARAEEETISYVWASSKQERVEELFNTIELKEGEVYLYDAFTMPEWRGKALYPAILSRQLQHFKQQGFRRALIFTVEENIASRRGITRAGFYHFQTIGVIKILNFALYNYGVKTPPHEVDVTFGPWKMPI